jgi:hypothetical protein
MDTQNGNLPIQSTICDYLATLRWAIIKARSDNMDMLWFTKSGTTEYDLLNYTIADQELEIKLIEDNYRIFQCNIMTSESSRQPVKIDESSGDNCKQINELVQFLVANPKYGDLNTKPMKTKIRDVLNAKCY